MVCSLRFLVVYRLLPSAPPKVSGFYAALLFTSIISANPRRPMLLRDPGDAPPPPRFYRFPVCETLPTLLLRASLLLCAPLLTSWYITNIMYCCTRWKTIDVGRESPRLVYTYVKTFVVCQFEGVASPCLFEVILLVGASATGLLVSLMRLGR